MLFWYSLWIRPISDGSGSGWILNVLGYCEYKCVKGDNCVEQCISFVFYNETRSVSVMSEILVMKISVIIWQAGLRIY